jgi:sensor histidine kinase YesM
MAQEKGNDELADGISKLSGMMRYMIYESNAETVPLKNEIEYIKSSIALNKLRYADNEALVNFHYGNQIPDIFIAPMLFIPFIENAFKHGVLINNTSPIDISIAVNDKVLLFTCENKNYSFVKKMENDKSGIGLENVKRRLELVYPARHELMIKSDEDQFRVELKIDLS